MSDEHKGSQETWVRAGSGCCSGSPTVQVPADFPMFDADFLRSNNDLTLVSTGGGRLQVADYFAWSRPPRLVRGDSEFIDGELVTRLALYDPAAGGSRSRAATGAKVDIVDGQAQVISDTGESRPAQQGTSVREGDVLLLSGGKVSIVLPEGGRLEAGGSGRVIFEDLSAAASADGRPIVLRADGGSFVFLGADAAVREEAVAVVILTPAARIGPARSAFAFRHSTEEGLRIWLQEDAEALPVVVENRAGRVVLDHAGARAHVAGSDDEPQRLPAEGTEAPPEETDAAASAEPELGERSPGGDEDALPGDPIVVTGQADPFDLLPGAVPLPAPPIGVLLQSSSLPSGPRRLTEEVLLQFRESPNGGAQQPSGPQRKFLRDWDQEPGGGAWEVSGNADVFGAVPEASQNNFRRPISPVEGRHMALLQPDPASLGEIDSFLGLPRGSVAQAVAGAQPAAGSAIKRTMTLTAGSELSFDWFFDAGNEVARQDYSLFTIDGRVFKLADSEGMAIGGATGWRTFVYSVPTTKTVTVGFAAINDVTPDGPSRLMVDNVRTGRTFDDHYVEAGSGPSWRVLVQKARVGDDVLATSADGQAATTALALLANDVDPDPFDAMGIAGIETKGTRGRVKLSGTGEITYDASGRFDELSLGETKIDEFRYEVDAGNGARSFGTVRVTVLGVNDAPTAALDNATVSADGSAVVIDVLGNDDDVDNDDDRGSLEVVEASSASGARVDVSGVPGGGIVYRADARFTYLAAGETTIDRVTYHIQDRHGARASGIAEVKVEGVNDAPKAIEDVVAADEDAPVAIDVLANDRDPDLTDRPRVVAVEGLSVVAGSKIDLASGAAVLLNADGRLAYDPAGRFAQLAEGEQGTDTFRYRIDDGHGGTAEASVSMSIVGSNDAPTAQADTAVAAEDGPTIQIDALGNDDDVDGDDDASSLRIVAASAASGAGVTFSGLPGEGLTYAVDGRFEALAEGETGFDTVTYVIQDQHGAQATATATIAVVGANDAPVAGADQLTVSEDTGAAAGVLGNDRDPDTTDRLQVLAIDGSQIAPGGQVVLASGAVVTLAVDGTLAYDPVGRFEALSRGQVATDRFSYTVGDGHGGTSDAVATVTIEGRNDAPATRTDDGVALEDGPAVSLGVLANDDDPDGDDDRSSLRIVSAHAQSGASVTFTGIAGAGLTYNPAGRFDFVGEAETATDVVTYTVQDRHGAQSTATATITITGANDAPKANDDLLMIDANTILSLPPSGILGNDRDPDASDRLRIIAVNGIAANVGRTVTLASGALLSIDADGNLIYDPNGRFDGLKDFERATEVFEYTVSDAHGSTASARATVQIQGRNDPPEAGADTAVTDEDSAARIPVLINDVDPDAGGNLRVLSLDTAGSRGIVRLNTDGTLTYDPNGAFDGLNDGESATDTFRYVLDDLVGGRSTGTVTVTVGGLARPRVSSQELLQSFEIPPYPSNAWPAEGSLQALAVYPLASGSAFVPTHSAFMGGLIAQGASVRTLEMFLSENRTVAGQPLVQLPHDAKDHTSPDSGAAIRSSLSIGRADLVNGHATLSFDWNFISAEPNPIVSGINDLAVFTLSDGRTAQVFALSDARSTTGVSNGWRTTVVDVTVNFPMPTAGDLRLLLGFAVVNDQVPWNPSSLLIDNVRLNRPIGSEFELIQAQQSSGIATYRQRPEASNDEIAAGVVDEDGPVNLEAFRFLGNDRASPGTTAATLRLTGVDATGSLGRVTIRDGGLVYDPADRFDGLAEGEIGTDQFLYVVQDANGGTSVGRATIAVAGVNDAPQAVADAVAIAEHSGPVAIDVLHNDDDVDSDDDRSTLRVVAAEATSGAVSLAGMPSAGLVYDPRDVTAFVGLGAGETARDTITYTLEDRHGARSTGSVVVTVTGLNDLPVGRDDQADTDEDTPATIAVLGNDKDPDLRDRLSVGAINGTVVSPGAQVALASGAMVLVNADGTLRYDPGAGFASLTRGQVGRDSFVYTAADGHGGSSLATVSVSIAGRNDAPVAVADARDTDAATPLTVAAATLLSNDDDADQGDSLRIVGLDVTGSKGSVSFDGTSFRYDPAGQFRSLGEGQAKDDTFVYRIADTEGATADGRVTVTVRGINDAPEALDDSQRTDEDNSVTVSVLKNDGDPDEGDRISVLSIDLTSTRGAKLTLNADNTVTYDPRGVSLFDNLDPGDELQDTFRYRITDSHGVTDEAVVTVTVEGRSDTERLHESFEAGLPVENLTRADAVQFVSSYQEPDGQQRLYAPTDGRLMAQLEAFGTAAQKGGQETVSKLEAFLGIPDRSLPRDTVGDTSGASPSFPATGSALKLKVNVVAGDRISFDWMFDARDILPDNDYAVFTVVGGGGPQVFKLTDTRETGSRGASGWRTSVYTASAAGDLTVGVAVVNDRSGIPRSENSWLLVDNVRLNADLGESYQVSQSGQNQPFETIALN